MKLLTRNGDGRGSTETKFCGSGTTRLACPEYAKVAIVEDVLLDDPTLIPIPPIMPIPIPMAPRLYGRLSRR